MAGYIQKVKKIEEVHCPYCNGLMQEEYEEDVYWFECEECGSRSPRKYGDNGLRELALKRYIPKPKKECVDCLWIDFDSNTCEKMHTICNPHDSVCDQFEIYDPNDK